MSAFKNHLSWQEFRCGKSLQVPEKKPFPDRLKPALKRAMKGSQLHWIDSWADGIIKTDFHPLVLKIADTDTIIDATIGWVFDWQIDYTFYCKTQFGEFYEVEYATLKKTQRFEHYKTRLITAS